MKLTQIQMVIVFVITVLLGSCYAGYIVMETREQVLQTVTEMEVAIDEGIDEATQEFNRVDAELDKGIKDLEADIQKDLKKLEKSEQEFNKSLEKETKVFTDTDYKNLLKCVGMVFIVHDQEIEEKKEYWSNIMDKHEAYAYSVDVPEQKFEKDVIQSVDAIISDVNKYGFDVTMKIWSRGLENTNKTCKDYT